MTGPKLVFDVEANTFELDKLTVIHCICAYDADADVMHEFVGPDIAKGVTFLESASWLVGHNIIDFDLPALKQMYGMHFTGKKVDTLILSRCLNPDRQNPFTYSGKGKPHSIEVWGQRLGHAPKIQMEDFSVLTPELLQRCREDVMTNWAVYKELYKEAQ